MRHLGTLALVVGVTTTAAITKFGAASLAARDQGARDARTIGLDMVPRGATAGVVDPELFAAIVTMSIATTVLVPPLPGAHWRTPRRPATRRERGARRAAASGAPAMLPVMSLSALRSGPGVALDGLRTQMWPLPVLGIVLGLGLGIGLPRLDAAIDDSLSSGLTAYLFGGGASAARTLLGTIAGSLITVTSLTFSLTVVTLQLASSQFSPRLLRTFTRDRFVHLTLALFLGTFTYALAVLRTVRDARDSQPLFVPQVSVTLAFVLAVASVLGLVVFLTHLAKEIRVETMLRRVRDDAASTVRRLLDERPTTPQPDPPAPPGDAVALEAVASGFLVGLDEEALLTAAVEADAMLTLDCVPGGTLVAGTPIGVAWSRGGAFEPDALSRLRERVARAVTTGSERTAAQDVGYGLRQITDVASKALSPGVNDPTTAVHALAHSSALLCELTGRDLGPRLVRDEHDEVRVVLARRGFGDMLELALAQPRHYGAADPFVLAQLFTLLRELAWCARATDQQDAIADQLARLRRTVAAQEFDDSEVSRMAGLGLLVERAQARRWTLAPRTL